MGILFKIILFGLVIYYILKTVGGFIFRIMGGQAQQQQQQNQRQARHQKREGDINIDYVPKGQKGNTKANGSKSGDYIDYEEIK